uniref:Transposase Tc1-like domain-containing protein n=1 Tax=Neogobius melanostomus TaxID=47308 RepID=A0A8C6TKP7_9GOBI
MPCPWKHKSGSSLGAISLVQTIIRNLKKDGNIQSSYRSESRRVLCPRDEHLVSSSRMKQELYQHGLRGYSARKKRLLHKKHQKDRLEFANKKRLKTYIFGDISCGLMEKKGPSSCLEEKVGILRA